MDRLWQIGNDLVAAPAARIVVTIVGAMLVSLVLTRILRAIWERLARRTRAQWDDRLAADIGGPLSAVIAVQLFRVALAWIAVGPEARGVLLALASSVTVACVVWGAFRFIDLGRSVLAQQRWAVDRPASRSLLALGARFVKVAVLVLGALVGLSQLGVSIASLIAGLGIGGLVIALAAQKTVENVFGAVSIGIDQPMREGDFVHVYDFVGTVEQIGLRSTRIRTLDRTIVTVPNGDLANQRIESYTARDRIRLACTIGLEYRTTAAQMREAIAALRDILSAHPKIWPDAITVRFVRFGESSLDVDIMAWFQTADWNEFQAIREAVFLDFMVAIERVGTGIAFPTRTLYVAGGAAPAATAGP
ncbi:MAG TPA: mechanosensitive ion channel family protein [Kofleriaceae bacterium]